MNCIGNGEAKEVTCATHGHELRGGAGQSRDKGKKKIGKAVIA